MDPIIELALLQRRFPDVPVKECGNLVKGKHQTMDVLLSVWGNSVHIRNKLTQHFTRSLSLSLSPPPPTSDVFCARNLDFHTYEGRLFVTEKAVFFVSS